MARPRKKQIKFSKAVEFEPYSEGAYIRHLRAQNKSNNTLIDYNNTFRHFLRVMDDRFLRDYTIEDIEEFLAIMSTEHDYQRNGVAPRPTKKRSSKTILNFKVALSSLWTWATARGYAEEHVVQAIPNPKVHTPPIEPLEPAEVAALIRAAYETRPWSNNPLVTSRRASGERDKAMIMLFSDTAARASEAMNLRLDDLVLYPKTGKIHIIDGKNEKSRWVEFGRRTAQAMQDWLDVREEFAPEHVDFLFVGVKAPNKGQQLGRAGATQVIRRLAKKAGIQRPVTPQVLRVTAACELAEHVSVLKLMEIMGHSNIETTYRYIRAAKLRKQVVSHPMDELRL